MKKKIFIGLLVVLTLALLAGSVAADPGPIITSVSRGSIVLGPSPGGLQENSTTYADRTYIWQNVPVELEGADYVKTYCNDKSNSGVSYAVTLSQDATLYVLIDDRYIAGTCWRSSPYEPLIDPPFLWLSDSSAGAVFTDTGLRLSHTGYHSGSNCYYQGKFWVYAADVSAGTYTLGRSRDYEPYISSRTFYGIAAVEITVIAVDIDIKPGSFPNCFNNDDHGVIPVAILSTATFDAPATVDPASVQLGSLEVKMAGKSGKYLAHSEDVNGDGFDDLVVKIQDEDGAFAPGTGTATVTGNLLAEFGGTAFTGSDEICVVP